MKHIFVVDDEKNIRELINMYLKKEGYKVTMFSNGENLISEINRLKADLVVLDIMMEGLDGLEICKEIRKNSDIPIIFVSARGEEFDRILGLELGADDYLSKPFSPRELVVRIKTILRRLNKTNINNDIKVKDITIYVDRRIVKKDENEIKFTTKEYELIEFLSKNMNMPFTREALMNKVWGYDYIGDERAIDDLIKRLRKKLKDADSEVKITTVWGYGYRMDG